MQDLVFLLVLTGLVFRDTINLLKQRLIKTGKHNVAVKPTLCQCLCVCIDSIGFYLIICHLHELVVLFLDMSVI